MALRRGYNPKRKILPQGELKADDLKSLADKVNYSGSPYHKRYPEDYGLTPPAKPRPDKTLCDALRRIRKNEAQELLKDGLRKGMVSIKKSGQWPQNVWSVSQENEVFEAQLDNRDQGTYHGYPLLHSDSFRDEILEEWGKR